MDFAEFPPTIVEMLETTGMPRTGQIRMNVKSQRIQATKPLKQCATA
jgi:hypothetical protein